MVHPNPAAKVAKKHGKPPYIVLTLSMLGGPLPAPLSKPQFEVESLVLRVLARLQLRVKMGMWLWELDLESGGRQGLVITL